MKSSSTTTILAVGTLLLWTSSMDTVQSKMFVGTTTTPAEKNIISRTRRTITNLHDIVTLRGGASAKSTATANAKTTSTASSSSSSSKPKSKKKKTKTKKKSTKAKTVSQETEEEGSTKSQIPKEAINQAMKEKSTAEALGDAIRDRADVLREEDPLLQSIDWSVNSVGRALGASDLRREGGGVQAAQSSVIANYFLKSHGGAHALQSLCSALATFSGLGSLALLLAAASSQRKTGKSGPNVLAFVMMQRTILFAMMKHISGMLAAASIAAKAIPKIGLSQARQWMEQLVVDPVSQYVFFTALLLAWLPSKQRIATQACWWWNKGPLFPAILLSPILLREVLSNILVASDVLVLWSVVEEDPSIAGGIEKVLKISQSVINAVMSLLVSPTKWRSADPSERQAILAKLVGKVSLVLEVAIGAFLLVDIFVGLFGAAFTVTGGQRSSTRESLLRLLCVRLYLHFLWIRRSSIKQIGLKIRGGASQLPFWFLDTLMHPGKAMGVELAKPDFDPTKSRENQSLSWKDYIIIGMGLNEDTK